MSIDSLALKGEEYEISDQDLLDMTDNKYQIYKYHSLGDYDNIDDVLGSYGGCIIIFQNESANSGHWVCLFKKDNNTLEFFDSYGLKPDDELKYSKYNLRIHNNKPVPHLSHLLDNSNYKIIYNKYKFQKWKHQTNTCGRHVGYRLKNKHINIEEYKKLLMNNKNYDSDFWVTVLTHEYGTKII